MLVTPQAMGLVALTCRPSLMVLAINERQVIMYARYKDFSSCREPTKQMRYVTRLVTVLVCKLTLNIRFHSIRKWPTRNSRYANVVLFRLALTKNQSPAPQQQDIDVANIEREETSRTGIPASHTGTATGRTGTSTGHVGTSANRLGTSSSHSRISTGCSETSGHAGTSASHAGTPVQFGGDGACKQKAELAANHEREVRRSNLSQLPHKWKIIMTRTWIYDSNSTSGMRRELTRSVRQVIHSMLKRCPMAT